MRQTLFHLSLILLALAAVACAPRERVISVRGGLIGIPGASGGHRGASTARTGAGFENILADESDIEAYDSLSEAGYLRLKDDDGNIILVSRSPAHVVFHLRETLVSEEVDLLYSQVLSERTKQNYRSRGMDPMLAVEYLARNRNAVLDFLATIPMGEKTPGVLHESIGRNMFRYKSGGAVAMGLKFSAMDVIIEDKNFRLLLLR